MHHLVGIDFAHRQLLEADLVRFIAAGVETHEVVLPRFLGVPMKSGQPLAIYAGWHNPGPKDYEGVYIRLAMLYLPANTLVKPIAVFPVQMDVNNTPGQPNVYDLPPGKTSRVFEFTMPISGRFLGVGGHLHDYGVDLRLEDVATGKVLSRVTTQRDSVGHVISVGRKYYPLLGLRMEAGHRYRVVGSYESPQKDTHRERRDGDHGRRVRAERPVAVARRALRRSRDARGHRVASRRLEGHGAGDREDGSHAVVGRPGTRTVALLTHNPQ